MKKRAPGAPSHLSAESKSLWRAIQKEFCIDDAAGIKILQVALEAFDRAQRCRVAIDRDGETITDRFGSKKINPLCPAERDSRAAFLAGLKALNLEPETEEPKKIGRPLARGF